MKNVADAVDRHCCVGCGACAYVCPKQGIALVDVLEEGIRPEVGDVDCTGCTDCLRVCPGVETTAPSLNGESPYPAAITHTWGPILEIWEGHASDPEIRFQGSSGGLLTALSLLCLEQKGMYGILHIGQDPQDPLRNATALSRSRAELLAKTGSRYAPASACDRLDLIETAPGPCVFIGQPSEVCALEKARKLRRTLDAKVGVTLSFFCAGSPARLGTVRLIEKLGLDPARVEHLRYRGRGWPGMFSVTLKGESTPARQISYQESWGFVQAYRPWSVKLWPDGSGEWADIACGDAWHRPPQPGDAGSSLIVIRTENGRRIFREALAAGAVQARPATVEMLGKAAAGLLEKKRAIWGRQLAMRALLVPITRHHGQALFKLWWGLPWVEKLRSTLGTARRILQGRHR
ncbi:MAG: Coenzyme F420 hydrogenase/dehydrogenase, beta subunit C-terminal domain [Limisphaerales bacterium]